MAAGRRPSPDHANPVPLGSTATNRSRRSSNTSTSRWPCTTCRTLTPDAQEARLAEFLVADRRAGFDLDDRSAVAPHPSPARAGRPALRVHLPPRAARHERGLDDRGGVALLRRRRGAARWPSSSSVGRTGSTSSGCTSTSTSDRDGGAGATTPSCSRASTRRPSCSSLEGAEDATASRQRGVRVDPVPSPGRTSAPASTPSSRPVTSAAPSIVEAAWGLVLAAFSGTTDVVFGSTRGCRRSGVPGSEDIMGLFINTPPVRVTIDPAEHGRRAARRRARPSRSTTRAHEHTALSDIQAISETRPSALFDTIVVVNELHQGTRLRSLGGPFAHARLRPQRPDQLPADAARATSIRRSTSSSRTTGGASPTPAIERVRDLLVELLTAIVDHADEPVAALPRVPAAELATMREWNAATDRPFPSGRVRARAVRGAGRPHSRRHGPDPPLAAPHVPAARRAGQRRRRAPARARGRAGLDGRDLHRPLDRHDGRPARDHEGRRRVRADGPGVPVGAHRDDARGLARRRRAHPLAAGRLAAGRPRRRRPRHLRRRARRADRRARAAAATTSPTSSSPPARPAAPRA